MAVAGLRFPATICSVPRSAAAGLCREGEPDTRSARSRFSSGRCSGSSCCTTFCSRVCGSPDRSPRSTASRSVCRDHGAFGVLDSDRNVEVVQNMEALQYRVESRLACRGGRFVERDRTKREGGVTSPGIPRNPEPAPKGNIRTFPIRCASAFPGCRFT